MAHTTGGENMDNPRSPYELRCTHCNYEFVIALSRPEARQIALHGGTCPQCKVTAPMAISEAR